MFVSHLDIKYGDDQEKVEKRFTKIGKDHEL